MRQVWRLRKSGESVLGCREVSRRVCVEVWESVGEPTHSSTPP